MPVSGLRDYQAYVQLDRQVRRLEQGQQRRAGSVQNRDTYQFRISPTCPPSTSIVLRGGLIWNTANWVENWGWYIPSYTIDLTDTAKARWYNRTTYTFTNAGWYAPGSLVPRAYSAGLSAKEEWPDTVPDNSLYMKGTTGAFPRVQEFETAAEAEERLLEYEASWGEFWGPPTTGLIIRNNGNITESEQYLPVDPVNRGRSYLFMNITPGWFTV